MNHNGGLHNGDLLAFRDAFFYADFLKGGRVRLKGSTRFFGGVAGVSFARASQAYALNAQNTLISFASGVPRLVDGRGLLPEAAATNLWRESQTFQTTWTPTAILAFGSGSTVNAADAPDGTTTADLITEDTTASSAHGITQTPSVGAGTTFTASVFVKRASGSRHFCFQMVGSGGADYFTIYFNLTTGAVGSSSAVGTASVASSSIQALANGWYRCVVTGVCSTTVALASARVRMASGATAGTETYDGDGASGLYLWGAQLEATGYATSYIPTTTASVTRAADVISIGSITGLDYPMTLFAEFERASDSGATQCIFVVDAGDNNDRSYLAISSTDTLNGGMFAGGVSQGVPAPATVTSTGVVYRAAARFATNSIQACIGAVLGTEDVSATAPATPTTIRLGIFSGGANPANSYLRKLAIFPSAYTDAQLQELTR